MPARQTDRSVEPQHQPDVLDGSSGCALAEIIEPGDEDRVVISRVRKDPQLHAVRIVQALRLEALHSLPVSDEWE